MDYKAANRADRPEEFVLKPVGVIKIGIKIPPLIAGEERLVINELCESAIEKMSSAPETLSGTVLDDGQEELVEGIDDYSHLLIVYWGHKVGDEERKMKKIHPGGPGKYPSTGIYSTYSPARPNPVLITVVKLIKNNGGRLTVMGLDAIDNSPVLDIKPYVAELFSFSNVETPGMDEENYERIHRRHQKVIL